MGPRGVLDYEQYRQQYGSWPPMEIRLPQLRLCPDCDRCPCCGRKHFEIPLHPMPLWCGTETLPRQNPEVTC